MTGEVDTHGYLELEGVEVAKGEDCETSTVGQDTHS